jgi:hypothetical protein
MAHIMEMDFHEATAALAQELLAPEVPEWKPAASQDVALSLKPVVERPASRRGRRLVKPAAAQAAGRAAKSKSKSPPTNAKLTVPGKRGRPKAATLASLQLVGDDPQDVELAGARLYHTKHVDKLPRQVGPEYYEKYAGPACKQAEFAAGVEDFKRLGLQPTQRLIRFEDGGERKRESVASNVAQTPDSPVLNRYPHQLGE